MKRIDIAIVRGYDCVSQIHVTNTFPKWPYDFLKKCLKIKKKVTLMIRMGLACNDTISVSVLGHKALKNQTKYLYCGGLQRSCLFCRQSPKALVWYSCQNFQLLRLEIKGLEITLAKSAWSWIQHDVPNCHKIHITDFSCSRSGFLFQAHCCPLLADSCFVHLP